jgi:hypothetical protein
LSEEVRIIHQDLTVEVTVVLQLNQGVCTDVLYPHPCLIFSLFLSFVSKQKKGNREQANMNEDKMTAIVIG